MQEDRDGDGKIRRFAKMASFASVGIEMGVAVFVGWGVGYWLDKKLGTTPWMMLVFLLLGVAAGFRGLIRAAKQYSASMRASAKSDTDGDAAAPNEMTRRDEP